MNKTLILTGRGYTDYAVAGALALRHFGDADILAVSKRRLPELLEEVKGYTEIAILGVSLEGDVERLAKALARLKHDKVDVHWISGLDFPECIGDEIKSNFKSYVSASESVSYAVAEYYDMDHSEFDVYLDERQPIGKSYMTFLEAADYCQRNYQDEQSVPRVIRHIAAKDSDNKWSESEKRMVDHYKRYGHRELVGKSAVNQRLLENINRIAPHEHARVLILGETGTGKETVAQQIHFKSPRKREQFIAFNCASVTPSLLESRFLGYEKGAFTGASEARPGIFKAADGGTLLLDEIGELPLEAQGILLRVLEEGRFQRMGENAREEEVNVRIIAATNRDLPAMVRDGKFRNDLFHRLCVVQLRVPPLREHKEDIPYIALSYRNRNNMGGRLTSAQIEALQSYDFPGNVRELNNLLERAYVLEITDYNQLIREHRELNAALLPQENTEWPDNLEEATRCHVKRVCEKYSNNITKAAEALRLSRNTVRKYLE